MCKEKIPVKDKRHRHIGCPFSAGWNMLRKSLNNKPIRWKILLINVAIFLLLAVFSCVLVYHTMFLPNERLLKKELGNFLSYSADSLGRKLKEAETLSNMLYSDSVIQSQLSMLNDANGAANLNIRSSISGELQHYVEQYQELQIRYISVQCGGFSYSTNDIQFSSESADVRRRLCAMADEADGGLVVLADDTAGGALYYTRAVRKIEGLSLQKIGYVTLSVDLGRLIEDATAFSSTYEPTMFALYQEDNALYADAELAGIPADTLRALTRSGYGVIRTGGRSFLGVSGSLSSHITGTRQTYDWQYYCMISYDSTFRELERSYIIFVAATFLAIVLSSLLISRLILPVTRQLSHLVVRMQRFDGSHPPEAEPAYADRTDEIGILHRQFEAMGQNICTLIEENYEKELLARQAQLQALMMQVNPHFLYNVLESINWRAHSAGLVSVSDMAEALGKLMRGTIDDKHSTITLSRELELVGHYVTIQKLRFEDALDYSEEINESFLPILVPKLSIQPLVDNAIRYGMANQFEGACQVRVQVYRSGENNVTICVLNSGSEFEDNLLEKLAHQQAEHHGTGIGLLNVDKRLRLMFGGDCGIRLCNESGFAKAVIVIPMNAGEEGDAAC